MSARARAREAVAATSRRLAAEGLLIGTAGNVSLAFDGPNGTEVALTATGIVLRDATAEQVSVVDLAGHRLDGELAVTSEVELHLGILRQRGAGAVVHTHSSAAVALSLVADELPCIHYQLLALGGTVRVVPFTVFGTRELADRVAAAMAGRQAAILANHGTVAFGADLAHATDHALLLEWAADLYLRAAAVGPPRALTQAQQDAVGEFMARIGYGAPRQA